MKYRCPNCNKKTGLLKFDCKYCNIDFCVNCRDIIIHNCNNLDDCKKTKKNELEKKLLSEKVKPQKIIEI